MNPAANMQSNIQIDILHITLDQILYLTNCLYRLTLHVHNHSFIDHVCIIMDSEESKPGHAVCLPEEHIDFLTVFFPKYVNLIGSVTHPRVPFLLCSICTQIIGLRVIATVDSFDVEMYCTNPL